MLPKIEFDTQLKCLYIQLRKDKVLKTKEYYWWRFICLIDYSSKKKIAGIELFF